MRRRVLRSFITAALMMSMFSTMAFAEQNINSSAPISIDKIEQINEENFKDVVKKQGNILNIKDFIEIKSKLEDTKTGIANDEKAKKLVLERIVQKRSEKNKETQGSSSVSGLGLNSSELYLMSLYPTIATVVFSDAAFATGTAENEYTDESNWLGNGDAFRHGFWNALMVKDVGITYAKLFADAHEAGTVKDADYWMDIANNQSGRNIGKNYSRTLIKSTVKSQIDRGLLTRVVNGKLTCTDSSGKR